MRVWPASRPLFSHQPFTGQGVSVYAGATLPLVYRKLKVVTAAPPLNRGTTIPIGATNVTKGNRIASGTGTFGESLSINADLSAYAGVDVFVDVRHYKDHVECEASHPVRVTLDGSGNDTDAIYGVGTFLNWTARRNGVVRITFRWTAASDGVQPETFQLMRTVGLSPCSVNLTARSGGIYTFDTPSLDDSTLYTFTVTAINTTSSASKLLFTVANVQPDGSGPPAVTIDSTEIL